MLEVKLEPKQFVELSDQVGGSLVSLVSTVQDLAFYVRDLRDAFYGGRQASFGSRYPKGEVENRYCASCEQPVVVPASLPANVKEFCSYTCMTRAQAEKQRGQ